MAPTSFGVLGQWHDAIGAEAGVVAAVIPLLTRP